MLIEEYRYLGESLTTEDIVSTMSQLNGWEDKYRQVIKWGKQLPKLGEEYKLEHVKVSGCESQVWLICHCEQGIWSIAADSDARIVRGLIVLVLAAYNGKSSEQVAAFDIDEYFKQLGLVEHLSPSRGNGLFAIVEQIKQITSVE
ncbi:SufE family protein [Vibrio sp. S4M6]|uniref:SufE family protein n=1 Tax=Vibrio sinus TaxID=2946865 RepID=UPI002029B8B3|nr:SufE family protein [Vibrio sinus]MCL9782219.1 SufE family protein [Vibrio sinus]